MWGKELDDLENHQNAIFRDPQTGSLGIPFLEPCFGFPIWDPWLLWESTVYAVKSSHDQLDGVGATMSQFFCYENATKTIHDFIWAKSVIDNATCRPVHDMVLGHE